MKTRTIIESGFDGLVVDVECHMSNGLPGMVIVGHSNRSVDEARERIRSAFAESNLPFPKKRITINLAPADLPKDQAGFDLAIAAAILQADKQRLIFDESFGLFGELGLDGSLKPVRGLIGKLIAARSLGLTNVVLPQANLQQAHLVKGLRLYPVASLEQLTVFLNNKSAQPKPTPSSGRLPGLQEINNPEEVDFADITGQAQAKRALKIAVAGGHNILLHGPPGTGKSMLAKATAGILPDMTHQEILEATHLHSLYTRDFSQIIGRPPIRMPHHSASDTAIIGGGQLPRPGEISLAHGGVLFFDEFPEFRRTSIEALRQPLEDGQITIARAKNTIRYPARFILIATANPCPCGFNGTRRPCHCSAAEIAHYNHKLSGPILDRIDLSVQVEHIEHKKLLTSNKEPLNSSIKKCINQARIKQTERYKRPQTNSQMTNQQIKTLALVTNSARSLLNNGAKKLNLSPRAYMRTIKVARTIADMAEETEVHETHIAEALQYRHPMAAEGENI